MIAVGADINAWPQISVLKLTFQDYASITFSFVISFHMGLNQIINEYVQ